MKRISLLKLSSIFSVLIMVLLCPLLAIQVKAEGETVKYRGYVENTGWMEPVNNGETCGTTGQSLRLEALEITPEPENLGIEYNAHVQDYGWGDYQSNGNTVGKLGEDKRIEAIKIRLTGEAANNFDIYYRGHIEDYGWLDWASNDAEAGSTGLAKRMEAVEITLLPKGSPAPGATDRPSVSKESSPSQETPSAPEDNQTPAAQPGISYSTHTSNIGWEAAVENGATAGHEAAGEQVEAMQAQLQGLDGTVEYNTNVHNAGWGVPMVNGNISGTTGLGLPIEAVNFYLYGPVRDTHDIYYRTYARDLGWLGWAKNGQDSGTTGGNKPIEAIQVVLTDKDAPAPGSTENTYIDLTPAVPDPGPGQDSQQHVVAQPGLRTVQNFLATALQPVGNTLYVWGGGWNEADDAAGPEAVSIGVPARWKTYFDSFGSDYNYADHKYLIHDGVDCSGFVGWAVYNIMNSANGGPGEVYWADDQAKWLASKGYGSFTPSGQVTEFLPGDIVSMEDSGHVYIVLGSCPDGSIVICHASPPGVMISGVTGPNGERTQAVELSESYMSRYYPEYYSRYSGQISRGDIYKRDSSKLTWSPDVVGDPDGIRNLDAAGVLKRLFNEQ